MERQEKRNVQEVHPKKHRRRKLLIILGSVLLALIIIRLILPYVILRYANKTLASLSEYTGYIEDIDLHLYRGAYEIKNITIRKIEKEDQKTDTIPFFKSSAIDLSVEWRQLFNKKVVAEVHLKNPVLNFVSGRHKDEDLKKDSTDFQTVLKKLVPITINRLEVTNGKVRFVDKNSTPQVDVALTNLFVVATNLTNVVDKGKTLPANIHAIADVYEGHFDLNIDFNPLIKQPTFQLILDLKNLNMVNLNDFLKAYGNFDVSKGTFSMYSEFAGKNGEFGGYVKPFITDFKVTKWKKEEKLGEKLWKTLVGTVMNILENPKTDKVATKIPISGRFDDPSINILRSISLVLRNAFVQALKPSFDNTISINDLEDEEPTTFLEKVFGGDKDKKDQKNDNDKKDKKNEDKKNDKDKKKK